MESKMKGVFRNTTNNTSRMAPGLAEKIMCKCVKKKKEKNDVHCISNSSAGHPIVIANCT